MSDEQKEKARLKRLRDDQIKSRDPGVSKIRHFDWGTTGRKSITKKPKPFLAELWEILPGRWKGAIYGSIFGLVLGLILLIILPNELDILAAIPILLGFIVGMVIGKTVQYEV
jgi:hypothetical protein